MKTNLDANFCETSLQEYYLVKGSEYAFLSYKHYQASPGPVDGQSKKLDEYDIGLVVTNDSTFNLSQSDSDRFTLRLKYFVVLTSSKQKFPRDDLERKLDQLKSRSIMQFPAGEMNKRFIFIAEF